MNRFFLTLAALSLPAAALATPQKPTEAQQAEPQPTPAATPEAGGKAPMMVSLAEMKRVELPERKGMQFALLSGGPGKGAYTQMRKVPAGTDDPPHAHSSELRNVVISGVWYTGEDAASARDFGPGSVVLMPADWAHVSGCRPGGDCVFYQEGMGRFDCKPVGGPGPDMKPGNQEMPATGKTLSPLTGMLNNGTHPAPRHEASHEACAGARVVPGAMLSSRHQDR